MEDAEGGELSFHALPQLTNDDVADLLHIPRTRILALLRRKGVIAGDTVATDAALADSEPALAGLAVASTLGTLPAGPALRRREPITLRSDRATPPPPRAPATLPDAKRSAATSSGRPSQPGASSSPRATSCGSN